MRLSQLLEELTVQLERSPTIPELAKAAGVEEEDVLEALEIGPGLRHALALRAQRGGTTTATSTRSSPWAPSSTSTR